MNYLTQGGQGIFFLKKCRRTLAQVAQILGLGAILEPAAVADPAAVRLGFFEGGYGCPAALVNMLIAALMPAALAASMTFTNCPTGASVSARIETLIFEFCAAWVLNSSCNLSSVTGRGPR